MTPIILLIFLRKYKRTDKKAIYISILPEVRFFAGNHECKYLYIHSMK